MLRIGQALEMLSHEKEQPAPSNPDVVPVAQENTTAMTTTLPAPEHPATRRMREHLASQAPRPAAVASASIVQPASDDEALAAMIAERPAALVVQPPAAPVVQPPAAAAPVVPGQAAAPPMEAAAALAPAAVVQAAPGTEPKPVDDPLESIESWKQYSAQYARFRRRMKRADVPPNIKEKLGTCEGRKEMWRLFAAKNEDMEEMSSHLMTVSLRQSQEQTRRHSWTTRAALESQLGVQDTDHVFSLARQQGRWRAHPSAPGVRQLEQVYFLSDESGTAARTDATELTTTGAITGALAADVAAGFQGWQQ